MRVGFVGLGKLGLPVAVTMASRGHDVRGWDTNREVRERIADRRPRSHEEPAACELLLHNGLELAPVADLVEHAELVFIAVQTPHEARFDGSVPLPAERRDFNYDALVGAVASVADVAGRVGREVTVAIISTILPGTIAREIRPLLPANVSLVYNPFFTADGTAVANLLDPELVLVGADDERARELLQAFYATLHGRPLFWTDVRTAEVIKLAYNTFIGQKIVFANAMMEVCEKVGADVDDLTEALSLADDRIISPRYLRAGMGDGGPCHPRDNIALSWLAERLSLSADIFGSMMSAREHQTAWLADLICAEADGELPIIILGKAFKAGSSLLDGSPAMLLAALLRDRRVEFSQYDDVVEGGPTGIGPHPALFFIATRHPHYAEASYPPGSKVIDPWGFVPDQDAVSVIRVGRRGPARTRTAHPAPAAGDRARTPPPRLPSPSDSSGPGAPDRGTVAPEPRPLRSAGGAER